MPAQPPAQSSGELSGGTIRQVFETPTADVEPPAEVPIPDPDGSSTGGFPPEVPGTDSAGNAANQYASTLSLAGTIR